VELAALVRDRPLRVDLLLDTLEVLPLPQPTLRCLALSCLVLSVPSLACLLGTFFRMVIRFLSTPPCLALAPPHEGSGFVSTSLTSPKLLREKWL
jgi:hypothetical protein